MSLNDYNYFIQAIKCNLFMQNLLSRINSFFKLAGVLKYPPKMKEEIIYYLNHALNENKHFDKDHFVKKI